MSKARLLLPLFMSILCITCRIPEDELPLEEWEVISATFDIATNTLTLTVDIENFIDSNTHYYQDYNGNLAVDFVDFIGINVDGFTLTSNPLSLVAGSRQITLGFVVQPDLNGTESVLVNTSKFFYRYGRYSEFGSDAVAKCRFKNTFIPIN